MMIFIIILYCQYKQAVCEHNLFRVLHKLHAKNFILMFCYQNIVLLSLCKSEYMMAVCSLNMNTRVTL